MNCSTPGLPAEKALATHSSTLAWRIPWMEEPGGLQSMGSQRVGHDWATSLSLFTFTHWRRKGQPTPVFLPGESQGQGSLVGCRLWGCTESDRTEATKQQQQQASLSITNSWSSLRLTSIDSVMPSSHLILYRPLLLLPQIPPSIRVFSNESTLCMRWPKYWSFSFSIIPSKEHPGLISFRMDWLDLLAVQGTSRVFSNTTVQKHQVFSAQLSL